MITKNLVGLSLLVLSVCSSSAHALAPMPRDGLYNNSDRSPLLAMLGQARRSIDIEIYTMEEPAVRRALRAALDRKVTVRIIKDGSPFGGEGCDVFGVPARDADCLDQQKLVGEVRSSGGAYLPFNKDQLCGDKGNGCFEHGKLAIIDRQIAMISTGNYDSSNLCTDRADRCNRDYSVVVSAQRVVDTLETVFEKDLKGERYDLRAVLDSFDNRALTISQLSMAPLVDFIRSARRTLRIQNQYVTDPTLLEEIRAAAKRGVQVTLNVSSVCAFGPGDLNDKKVASLTRMFSSLDEAGVRTVMFTALQTVGGKPGYLHAKSIIVDNQYAWVGSTNGSTMAVTQNREFGIFFNRPEWVGELSYWMNKDANSPNAETWQESLKCLKDPKHSDGG